MMLPKSGGVYCGEHTNAAITCDAPPTRIRIPCPYDKHHNVDHDKLSKHLWICNSRPTEKLRPYFFENINMEADLHHYCTVAKKEMESSLAALVSPASVSLHPAVPAELAPRAKVHLQQMDHADLDLVAAKVEALCKQYAPQIEKRVLRPTCAEKLFVEGATAKAKHTIQHASLVGNMEQVGLLGRDNCYVEFGAGKGGFAQAIQRVMGAEVLLIDRAAFRYKAALDAETSMGRLRVDIKDFCLSGATLPPAKPVIAIGKHLCGAATDVTLRCLFTSMDQTCCDEVARLYRLHVQQRAVIDDMHAKRQAQRHADHQAKRVRVSTALVDDIGAFTVQTDAHVASLPSETIPSADHIFRPTQVRGVAIALCCHQLCSWDSYCNPAFMRECGISADEFAVIAAMSSWAVCGTRPSIETTQAAPITSTEHEQTSASDVLKQTFRTPAEREALGYCCKLLLNVGRLRSLQERGAHAELVCYVEPEQSLENTLLLARFEHGDEQTLK
eukprot:TRINITY_DN1845_c0_g1_i2.p1 TRINITY_DN1845_c0_g1~~TRINITY_DN1845_c0_g1_i2.p1  ORF type:complete len:501 (-),score=97.17 TRINITY_DN1845_c0_g1_i2:1425-2927(-)